MSLLFALMLAQSPREPVEALPGAGRLPDHAATAARRSALMARMGRGVAIVRAGTSRDLEVDVLQDNDFRADDTFFYLTGLETPDAVLVLATRPDEAFLLLPARNPQQERWTGPRLGPGPEATRWSGVPTLSVASLDSLVAALVARSGAVREVGPAVDSMRVYKDADEVARLQRAIDITGEAHLAAMRAARPGLFEYQVEAVIEGTFRDRGADRVGFPSIVGSGPNATTLHYDWNRRRMDAGDLIVIDIGAEWGQYSADITRTIPVSGTFTPRQKAIYDLVLATQQAAIDAVRPGVTVADLNRIARTYMQANSGTLCGDGGCGQYWIHGLAHWLGMRVHDVGDYNLLLAAGAVLTIEPGIYLPGEGFGVRIEDDILVTTTGHEVLSGRIPRTTADIERIMREGGSND
ncbi:MAG: Xaa-Pro peptidase family protein [Gemmatimonadales bacterium]